MTCPKCHSAVDADIRICPECGAGLYRNVSGIIRTSAVLISTDGGNRFFASVQEVPERLRKQLMETTNGDNSGTIVIADRAGKEQLTKALSRRESAAHEEPPPPFDGLAVSEDAPSPEPAVVEEELTWAAKIPWLAWIAFFLILAGAAGISAFFGTRW